MRRETLADFQEFVVESVFTKPENTDLKCPSISPQQKALPEIDEKISSEAVLAELISAFQRTQSSIESQKKWIRNEGAPQQSQD